MRYPFNVGRHLPRRRTIRSARTFNARAAIDAQVAPAIYEMGAASAVLPLVCFGRGVPALEAHAMTAPVEYAIETTA